MTFEFTVRAKFPSTQENITISCSTSNSDELNLLQNANNSTEFFHHFDKIMKLNSQQIKTKPLSIISFSKPTLKLYLKSIVSAEVRNSELISLLVYTTTKIANLPEFDKCFDIDYKVTTEKKCILKKLDLEFKNC